MDEIYERDVVCGMYLFTTEGCGVSEVNGKKYFFCSKICKDEFEKNNARYLNMGKLEIADQSNNSWEQTSRDPVCGQMINIKDAKGSTLFMNNEYHFCSESCNNVFNNMPSAYADKGEEYFDPNNPNELAKVNL